MKVRIFITPRHAVRHPESEAILAALRAMEYTCATKLTKGYVIEVDVPDGEGSETLRERFRPYAERRANPVMEDFRIEVVN